MKAVIYAAKSTEDTHGSIPTQLKDCRALATCHEWEVVGPELRLEHEDTGELLYDGPGFYDEAFSAFKGNRGPDLARAKALAVQLAREHGRCVLVAQDADRFARGAGDAPGAADHLGELYFQMRRQGVALWSVRSGELDLLRAALEGERATDESQRKSQSVRAGLKRRKDDENKPVGPVPFGYVPAPEIGADGKPVLAKSGKAVTQRVEDAVNGPIVVWIFEQVAAGKSTGEIARMLNADGVKTQRGNTWHHRRVRDLIDNEAYAGKRGYPPIVDADLAGRARERLTRMDPAAVQQRKGGRPPSPAFVLRGVLFCACGAPMYCSQKAEPRAYVCREVIQCTGTCTRQRIPADLIEGHVLRHLDAFVGKDLEAWITERLATRSDEQEGLECTLDSRRSELAALERRREKRMAELDTVGITKVGLELIERIDAEREALATTIADIEARLSEFSTGPSSDAILDYYVSIRDAVTGRIADAKGPSDVAAVLADVFEGIWAELTEPDFVPLPPDERSLRATFVLRRPIESLGWLPAGEPIRDDDPIAIPWALKRDVLPPLPKPDARGSCTSSR
jgi:DNA invertase Pin-like site-specific DNA recombinase